MKNIFKLLITLILMLAVISSAFLCVSATQSAEIPYQSYTYWEDFGTSQKTPVFSKPMYEVGKVIHAKDLGADEDSKLNDIETDLEGNCYILDSGKSRVYILNDKYQLESVLKDIIYEGTALNFEGAKGIFVDGKGQIYIADTDHARVLVLDKGGSVKKILPLPESDLIPSSFEYRPVKVAVDSKGYTYIASDGSYYGAILYSPEMEFLGFFGANTVKASAMDVITKLWKRLTSNDIKRAADEISLPYTFTDIVVGPADFVYTATGRSGNEKIQKGQITMLNPGGKDVLNASEFNFADIAVGTSYASAEIQDMSGLSVDKDGFIYALDTTYGRVFWYDEDCSLLSVFGGSLGSGTQAGTFTTASAIALNGIDVLITDSSKNSLTVFTATNFGRQVRSAQLTTLSGDFAAALGDWEDIISKDVNCQLAYRGLGKAYYDIGENEMAMEFSKKGVDRETYAKAFEVRRTEMLEKNFVWLFLGLVFLIAVIIYIRHILIKKQIIIIKNTRIKTALGSVLHPVECFRRVKEYGEGSVIISVFFLALFYVITVLGDTASGFAFNTFDSENYNALYVFLGTVGLVCLWSISNWLICTLVGGIGRVREIFIVSCYSLIPIIFARLAKLILTHILTPKEGAFLGIFIAACTLYAAFMLILGIMRIHDFEFGKFVATTVFTVIAMLIIIFLVFLVFLLVQQIFGWVGTLYVELRYR